MLKHQLTLFGSLTCPYVQRVRFALESLKVDYEYVEIDLLVNEQRSEEYKKINPFGKVPSIAYNGKVLFESLVLLEFIEDLIGGVFPKDPIAKAQSRIWASQFDQTVQARYTTLQPLVRGNDEAGLTKVISEYLENARTFVKNSGLLERISSNPTSFFAGDSLSYVDFVTVPHILMVDRFLKNRVKKSLFDFVSSTPSEDPSFHAFKQYALNVSSTEAFKGITTHLKTLPYEKSSLLKELHIDSVEKFNYDEFLAESVARRF